MKSLKQSIIVTVAGSSIVAAGIVGAGIVYGDHAEAPQWKTVTTMQASAWGQSAVNSKPVHLDGSVRLTFDFDTSADSFNTVYLLPKGTDLEDYEGYPIVESYGSSEQDTTIIVPEGDYYWNTIVDDGSFTVTVEQPNN